MGRYESSELKGHRARAIKNVLPLERLAGHLALALRREERLRCLRIGLIFKLAAKHSRF